MGDTTTGMIMLSRSQEISMILEPGIIVSLSNAIDINSFKLAMSYQLISWPSREERRGSLHMIHDIGLNLRTLSTSFD